MKATTIRHAALAACLALFLAGCACPARSGAGAQGPGVLVFKDGKTRAIPEKDFDEARYLKRGYVKNVDPQGRAIYSLIPKTDLKRDDTFRGGNDSNKNRGAKPRPGGRGGRR